MPSYGKFNPAQPMNYAHPFNRDRRIWLWRSPWANNSATFLDMTGQRTILNSGGVPALNPSRVGGHGHLNFANTGCNFAFPGLTDYTLAFWFYYSSTTSGNQTVVKYGGVSYNLYNNNINATLDGVGLLYSQGTTLSANTWNHLAYTVSGSTNQTSYTNGVSDGSRSYNVGSAATLYLASGVTTGFSGGLDDISVWGHVKSATEITQIMRESSLGNINTVTKLKRPTFRAIPASVPIVPGTITFSNVNNTSLTAIITVSGGTLPITQQWYRATTTGFTPGAGNIVSGATSLTLNDTGLSASTTYYYKVVFSDAAPSSATSAEANQLTLAHPAIVPGSASSSSIGPTFATVTATEATGGTPGFTHQWYRSTVSGFTPGAGNIVSGATSLTLNDTGLSVSTTYYYVMVYTDTVSFTGSTTQLALTTNAALAAGAISTTSVSATTEVMVCTAATGGSGSYTYQWYRSTTNGFTPGAGNIVSGATSLTPTFTGLTASTTYYYRVIATDASSATATTSQASATTSVATYSIGFIGDSITQGNSLADESLTIPAMYAAYMTAERYPQTVTITNQGVSGSTSGTWVSGSANLNSAVTAFLAAGVSDVEVMLGTNDGYGSVSGATFQTNISSMCGVLLSNGFRVILNVPCTPLNTTNGDAYLAAIIAVANGTTILAGDKTSYKFFLNNTGYTQDSVHPTAIGGTRLAALWFAGFQAATKTGGTSAGVFPVLGCSFIRGI